MCHTRRDDFFPAPQPTRQAIGTWLKVLALILLFLSVAVLVWLVFEFIILYEMSFPTPMAAYLASLLPVVAQTAMYRIDSDGDDAFFVPSIMGSVDMSTGNINLSYDSRSFKPPFHVVLFIQDTKERGLLFNVTYTAAMLDFSTAALTRSVARPDDFFKFRQEIKAGRRLYLVIFPPIAISSYSRLFALTQARLVQL